MPAFAKASGGIPAFAQASGGMPAPRHARAPESSFSPAHLLFNGLLRSGPTDLEELSGFGADVDRHSTVGFADGWRCQAYAVW